MTQTIPAHGGELVDLVRTGAAAGALAEQAANLPAVIASERELADLEMLGVGALSPLRGFQTEADYRSVLETMHLTDGLAWAIPVVLSLTQDDAHRIGGADSIAIRSDPSADALAVLRVAE